MKRIVCLRISVFLAILVSLFILVQDILSKKWYYPNWSYNTYKTVNGMYDLEENSIDVVFAGTSHMECGVSPMEIYENNGILSYNLGTTGQPIEVSYYLLKEFMKKQTPKIILLDSSNLFYDTSGNANWRYILESMKFGKNKIEFGVDYSNNDYVSDSDGFWSTILPISKYHSRWKELNKGDFDLEPNDSFMGGYYMYSSVQAAPCSVDLMNEELNYFDELENCGITTWKYVDEVGEDTCNYEDNIKISDVITEEAEVYLQKIIQLCDEKKCELILTKVPSVYFPQYYDGAWTLKKYIQAKEISEKYNIIFLDLLYDGKIELDWNTDSCDGGRHLNLLGAEKVSRYYGDYLQINCGIQGRTNEKYERELLKYNSVKVVAELSMENDFETYLNLLGNRDNIMVLVSARNDFVQGMDESQLLCFRKFLKDTYSIEELNRHSLVGVVDDGIVMYEEISQGDIIYWYEEGNKAICLQSGGVQSLVTPSIKVNGIETCQQRNGINIVVYDKEAECVIDSVSFEFAGGSGYAFRADGNMKNLDEYIYSIGG